MRNNDSGLHIIPVTPGMPEEGKIITSKRIAHLPMYVPDTTLSIISFNPQTTLRQEFSVVPN